MAQNAEGDQILIQSLRESGSPIPGSVVSLKQFSSGIIVAVCSHALMLISNGEIETPARLPTNLSGRHKLGVTLGKHLKELGFTGECGYNTFLYPSERDTYQLMLWLVEKIPKPEEALEEEVLGIGAMLKREIGSKLREWSQMGHCSLVSRSRRCQRLRTVPLLFPTGSRAPREVLKYWRGNGMPLVTGQIPPEWPFFPSALAANRSARRRDVARATALMDADSATISPRDRSAQLRDRLSAALRSAVAEAEVKLREGAVEDLKGPAPKSTRASAFEHAAKFTQEGPELMEEEEEGPEEGAKELSAAQREAATRKKREDEILELEGNMELLRQKTAALVHGRDQHLASCRQLAAELAELRLATKKLIEAYTVKKRTLEMLPEAPQHLRELEKLCASTASHLVELATEWEKHRLPLMGAIRGYKEGIVARKESCREKVAEMKSMRLDIQTMTVAIRESDERIKRLRKELEGMPKGTNRAVYTYRIMDIIGQVRKQKLEIQKIIGDIYHVQKDINSINEKLTRTEGITDEVLYSAAKDNKGEQYIAAYREFSELKQRFRSLVETVRSIGSLEKSIRELEAQTDSLSSRLASQDLERVKADIQQVKAENEQLRKQV